MIIGKIYFLLVRIKIKNMELSIIRQESVGTGPSLFHEKDSVGKFGEYLNCQACTIQHYTVQKLWTALRWKANRFLFACFFLGMIWLQQWETSGSVSPFAIIWTLFLSMRRIDDISSNTWILSAVLVCHDHCLGDYTLPSSWKADSKTTCTFYN